MAGFTGPTTLGGLPFQGQSNDPVTQAILSRFPQLRPQSGGGNALQGYQFPGIDFGTGQGGLGSLNLFEGAKGSQAESITGGLALGTLGKSSSQASQVAQPGAGLGMLPSFPQPQLADVGPVPQQTFDFSAGSDGQPSGGSVDLGALVNAGAGEFNVLKGAQTFDPLGQMQTPGAQQQRVGERTDYSNATGSPSGVPLAQTLSQFGQGTGISNPGVVPMPTGMPGFGSDTTFSVGQSGNPLAPGGFQAETFSMPGAGEMLTAPGGSAEFALGNGGGTGQTDFLGAAQSGIGALGGLYNLAGGIAQGNALGATGGALQALGGGAGFLQSVPGLADALGLSGTALSGVGGAVGGIGGLYSLYQGIQSGDPVQMATGVLSAYQGGMSLIGAITGETAPGILTGLATIAPETSAAVATALTGTTVGVEVGAQGIATAISAAAAAWALPVAAVVMAIMDTLAEQDRQRVQNAGFTNNPIKGALYSASTEGVGAANQLLRQFQQAGGYDALSTSQLGGLFSDTVNSLLPYFATAQGGRGAIKASDTITGAGPDWAAKPYMGGQTPDEYTANFTNARQGVAAIVSELLRRGVPYEAIGQLPISGDWAGQSLDAGGTPQEFYAGGKGKYESERARILADAYKYGTYTPEMVETGAGEGAGWMTPTGNQLWQSQLSRGAQIDAAGNVTFPSQYGYGPSSQPDLLGAALGSSMLAPADVSNASSLMTDMYGGPAWAALARMGAPEFAGLIQEHFDPWVNLRNFNPQQLVSALGRDNPALRDVGAGQFMEGYTPRPPVNAPASTYSTYWSDLAAQPGAGLDYRTQLALTTDPALQQYQQQLADYQAQLDAFFKNALTPQPLALPTVETAGLLPSSTTAGFAPSTITGGGLTAEQLEWLRSQGWLAQ